MNIFKSVFDGIVDTATSASAAVSKAAVTISTTANEISDALPTSKQVRDVVGDVLILGGTALIDPRQAAGQAAVKLGEIIKPKDDDDEPI